VRGLVELNELAIRYQNAHPTMLIFAASTTSILNDNRPNLRASARNSIQAGTEEILAVAVAHSLSLQVPSSRMPSFATPEDIGLTIRPIES